MHKMYGISDSEGEEINYEPGYGSPDEDPPSEYETHIKEGDEFYNRVFWGVVFTIYMVPKIITVLGNLL